MARCYVATSEFLIKVASGHGNESGLTPFHRIATNRLLDYRYGGYEITWVGQESRQLTADRQSYIKIGLPSMKIKFPVITNAEVITLYNLAGLVTVRAYDYDVSVWSNYDATLFCPDTVNTESRFDILDYELSFIDMEAL